MASEPATSPAQGQAQALRFQWSHDDRRIYRMHYGMADDGLYNGQAPCGTWLGGFEEARRAIGEAWHLTHCKECQAQFGAFTREQVMTLEASLGG